MKNDPLGVTARRLWNEAVRDGVFEEFAKERRSRIREAFQGAAQDLVTPEDLGIAFSEVLALSLAELEGKFRISLALHRKVVTLLLWRLPEGDRKEVEHELRTLSLNDVVL